MRFEWTKRVPNPAHRNGVGELEDFQTEAVQVFRDLGIGNGLNP